MRKKLEFQADRIEAVLTLHQMPARVTGGTVTPRWVRFQVLPAVGAKISWIKGLSEELAAALDVSSCRVSRRGAAVDVEVPREDPQPVRLLPLFRQLNDEGGIPPMTAILGLAEDGAPLLIRLPSPDVGNVLVIGLQGAGKTTLLRAIALSLSWGNTLESLRDVQIVDNLETYDCAYQDRIAQMAWSPGVHVVAATASLDLVRWIGNAFPVRLVGRVSSVEDARTATGWSGMGAERLMGRGDFLAVAEGRVIHFQTAYVSPAEIQEVTAHLMQGETLPPYLYLSQ